MKRPRVESANGAPSDPGAALAGRSVKRRCALAMTSLTRGTRAHARTAARPGASGGARGSYRRLPVSPLTAQVPRRTVTLWCFSTPVAIARAIASATSAMWRPLYGTVFSHRFTGMPLPAKKGVLSPLPCSVHSCSHSLPTHPAHLTSSDLRKDEVDAADERRGCACEGSAAPGGCCSSDSRSSVTTSELSSERSRYTPTRECAMW